MDQWKAAFKQIYGKTPTKKESSLAPLSVRELPKSLEKFKGGAQKRKQLTVRIDGEFGSPLKLRKSTKEHLLLVNNGSETVQNAVVEEANCQNAKQMPVMGRRPIVCANVGQLLTPEKSSSSAVLVEDEEGRELGEEEEVTNVEGEQEGGGNLLQKTEEKKKEARRKKRVQNSDPNAAGNFVSVNLRRRRFAPISKFRGKKWSKIWKKRSKNRLKISALQMTQFTWRMFVWEWSSGARTSTKGRRSIIAVTLFEFFVDSFWCLFAEYMHLFIFTMLAYLIFSAVREQIFEGIGIPKYVK
uniref:Uncharacterized protein n=1 Tax=Globodera rostochiensis TaxID=31243 RepID=A0A914HRM7_GLORO